MDPRTRRLRHDLRSPLNGIIGFAQLIRDGKAGPVSEEQREFLGDILTSAHELARRIDEAFPGDADPTMLPKHDAEDP